MPKNDESIVEVPLSDELCRLQRRIEDAYKKCHVYEAALEYCGVTEEQRNTLEANKYYWIRIQQIEFEERSLLTETLHRIITNGKPSEQLVAVKMLGEIIYPEKFGKADKSNENNVRVEFYIPENGREPAVTKSKGGI